MKKLNSQPLAQQYKKAIWFLAGIAALAVVITLYNSFGVSVHETKLSCHTPKPPAENVEFCVYHLTRESLLGDPSYEVLVGRADDYGIVYGVPYTKNEVSTTWDAGTDVLHIAMPGTDLRINPETYARSR